MFGDNWDVLDALRERQASVYEDHRKANGLEKKLVLSKWFPVGFFFYQKNEK